MRGVAENVGFALLQMIIYVHFLNIEYQGDTTKPGLWTLDRTMDWTLDSIMGLDNWTRFSILRGQRLLSGKVMMFLVL